MRESRKAFTLIELLVVIAIIALLATILMPALNQARELGRRAVCQGNQSTVGKGLQLYATNLQNGGVMPHPGNPTSGGSWNHIGDNRNDPVTGPNFTENHGNTRGLWMLVRQKFASTAAFICPTTDDTPSPSDNAYDFLNFTSISYSYQNQWNKGTALTNPQGVALLADRNPYFCTPKDATDTARDATALNQNTRYLENHKGEGQAVLFLDGHVIWAKTSDPTDLTCKVGVDGDNIWVRGNSGTPVVTTDRADSSDSFLVP